jgi:phthalate 4,5-dioxygenase
MLTRVENEYMCRVGPGTPMGDLLRRYWVPAIPSTDLPEPDGAPVTVRRLGEDLVAFRNSEGTVGVLSELCTHRGASLKFGRVEDCGIRCLYHGWKYGTDGVIQETPNFPDSRFRQKIKAPAYPVFEGGGIIWIYMGPADKKPKPPNFQWMAGSNRRVHEFIQPNCNFVQALEGGLDSSHVGILHGTEMTLATKGDYDPNGIGADRYPTTDVAPRLEVENTDFGFHYAAIRDGIEDDTSYVRITPYIMPWQTSPAGGSWVLRVARDDDSTSVFSIGWAPDDAPPVPTVEQVLRRDGMGDPAVYGPDKVLRVPEQDREAMRRGESFTGIVGFNPQDGAMTMNMGAAIFDRSREHVVPADYAILRMRRLLIDNAKKVERGEDPVGVSPDLADELIVGASGVIQVGDPWQTLVPGNRAMKEDDSYAAGATD